jgi:hypothetical protein
MIGGDEATGMLVMSVDVPGKLIDQIPVDGVALQAVVDEMRNVVALGRRCEPASGLLGKQLHRIRSVGPQCPKRLSRQ